MIRFPLNSSEGYLIGFPKGFDERQTYPMIVFFHGRDGQGDGTQTGLANLDRSRELPTALQELCYDNGIILFAAQSKDSYWDYHAVNRAINTAFNLPCFNELALITGLSMGGGAVKVGTTSSVEDARRFQGALDICGVGGAFNWKNVADAKLPYWFFHAANDPTVPASNSEHAIKSLQSFGYEPLATFYLTGGHVIWNKVYSDTSVQRWIKERLNIIASPIEVPLPEPEPKILRADFEIIDMYPNRIWKKLDARNSTGAVGFKWDIISRPKEKRSDFNDVFTTIATTDGAQQSLKYLSRGWYTLRLTVTGKDGSTDSTEKSFEVL